MVAMKENTIVEEPHRQRALNACLAYTHLYYIAYSGIVIITWLARDTVTRKNTRHTNSLAPIGKIWFFLFVIYLFERFLFIRTVRAKYNAYTKNFPQTYFVWISELNWTFIFLISICKSPNKWLWNIYCWFCACKHSYLEILIGIGNCFCAVKVIIVIDLFE